jgi:hypothetical protein
MVFRFAPEHATARPTDIRRKQNYMGYVRFHAHYANYWKKTQIHTMTKTHTEALFRG